MQVWNFCLSQIKNLAAKNKGLFLTWVGLSLVALNLQTGLASNRQITKEHIKACEAKEDREVIRFDGTGMFICTYKGFDVVNPSRPYKLIFSSSLNMYLVSFSGNPGPAPVAPTESATPISETINYCNALLNDGCTQFCSENSDQFCWSYILGAGTQRDCESLCPGVR